MPLKLKNGKNNYCTADYKEQDGPSGSSAGEWRRTAQKTRDLISILNTGSTITLAMQNRLEKNLKNISTMKAQFIGNKTS